MGKLIFETKCGKKHPVWVDALHDHFKHITRSNNDLTWLSLCDEMNEELQAIRKRSNVKPKTNFVAEIGMENEKFIIAIKRNNVVMAVIRYKE